MAVVYDFGKYPDIQQHLRHLAAFGMLDETHIKELIDALGLVLGRLDKLEQFKASIDEPREWPSSEEKE